MQGDKGLESANKGLFLSTRLHNLCLGWRGHDLSNKDNVVGLWLSGIHGKVVAKISQGVGVVIPLYVLVLVIGGCLL